MTRGKKDKLAVLSDHVGTGKWQFHLNTNPGQAPTRLVDLTDGGRANGFIHPIGQDAIQVLQFQLLEFGCRMALFCNKSTSPWLIAVKPLSFLEISNCTSSQ